MPRRASKILLVSYPLRGHCAQMIAMARALRERGHEALFAVPPPGHQWLEGTGVPVVTWWPQGSSRPETFHHEFQAVFHRIARGRFIWPGELSLMKFVCDRYFDIVAGLRPVLEECSPDLVIADHAVFPVLDLAAEFGVPCIRNARFLGNAAPTEKHHPQWGTPYLTNMNRCQRAFNRWIAVTHVPRRLLIYRLEARRRGRSNPAPTLGQLLARSPLIVGSLPELEVSRPLPASVYLVGPIFPRDQPAMSPVVQAWLDQSADRDVVYVGFGTLASITRRLAQALLDGIERAGVRALWSLPAEQRALITHVPTGVRLETSVAQASVLAHPAVRAMVTHGGRNSLHEGLRNGLPVVCMPFFGDQHYNAARVVDSGLGVRLTRRQRSAERIALALQAVLRQSRYRQRAQRVARSLHAASSPSGSESDGLTRAVHIIEQALAGTVATRTSS